MQNPSVGRALRDSQLDLFELRDAEFLERCRALAVDIARRKGTVSINDIRELVSAPPGVSPSVFGAVFKGRQWQVVGVTQATHPEAHARLIRTYAIKKGEENGQ